MGSATKLARLPSNMLGDVLVVLPHCNRHQMPHAVRSALATDLEICLKLLLHGLHARVLHVLQAVYDLQVPSQGCAILLFCVL